MRVNANSNERIVIDMLKNVSLYSPVPEPNNT